jgi:hypothetical protein
MNYILESILNEVQSSSSLTSYVTDFGHFFFAVLRQNIHHCCPLLLVQFTIPEDMFLRLQPVTTFAFSRGHKEHFHTIACNNIS